PVVLLVDEIDKAEPEFEAFLLEVLSDFQVSVPELGTVMAKHIPLVVRTSNNARGLPDGLKRRCLHLFIDFPSPAEELEIIRLKVPEIPEKLARGGGGRAEDPRDGSAQAPVGLRVARLGAFARDPERAGALAGARRVHADDAREAREGSRAREGRPRQGPRRLIVDERILEFIGDLRRAEIRVSPSEALDALAASAEVGLADREAFKYTLAATMIKEFRDQPKFDGLFDL